MSMTRLDVLATVIIGAHVAVKESAAPGSITWAKAIAEALMPHGLQESRPEPQRVALQLDVATSLAESQVKEIAALVASAKLVGRAVEIAREAFEDQCRMLGFGDELFVVDEHGVYVSEPIRRAWQCALENSKVIAPLAGQFLDVCKPGAC